ncbi:MAG: hypothetical protein GY750_17145 [Lentisphaerae bacterium]|nr:hypothetical protein [Lentisphaerota bacterium]MCP4103124.1 hypothetical protein [Lentisphaerota bacterium]
MTARKSEGKNDPDSKRTGGTCGEFIGCLVILIAVLGVIFWVIIKPKLEEAGYNMDDLLGSAKNIKNKISDTVETIKDKYDSAQDTIDTVKDKASDIKDNLNDNYDNIKDKAEDLKDKAQDTVNNSDPQLIPG